MAKAEWRRRNGEGGMAKAASYQSDASRFVVVTLISYKKEVSQSGAKKENWTVKNNNPILSRHRVVSNEEWLEARRALLREEKEAMKRHDEFTKRQRDLPWRKVEKSYIFATTAGDVSLCDLFEGRTQLFIKHFMMGPDQDWQCPGCTLEVSHVDGLLDYFEHHDMSYVAVGRAPIAQIEAVRRKMGWKFKWVSSSNSDFNYDFHVSFRPAELANHRAIYNFREFDPKESEDLSGNSIFYKDKRGQVFHTYSTFGRGGEQFLGIYGFFDLLPRGREENGPTHALPDWASFKTKHIHNYPKLPLSESL